MSCTTTILLYCCTRICVVAYMFITMDN
uniref:Uncharacterized protein n=1 Tax=Arundo donax TaxID=35708 RepID=A0A0A8XRY4_ARUDO